jgi:hypothetical protein
VRLTQPPVMPIYLIAKSQIFSSVRAWLSISHKIPVEMEKFLRPDKNSQAESGV